MKTRLSLTILALACSVFAHAGLSQQRAVTVGYLVDTALQHASPSEAFIQGLRERGWVEGKNLKVEYRYMAPGFAGLPEYARELAAMQVDVIFAPSPPIALAAKEATSTIPIVFATVSDPVANGLVASLGRPGVNVTGIAVNSATLAPKRLEILKEVVPKMSQAAVLFDADNYEACELELKALSNAANALGVKMQPVAVKSAEELPQAFSVMVQARSQAIYLPSTPVPNLQLKKIAQLAAANRLPVMYEWSDLLQEGNLVAYGPSITESYRRAAFYVDRILRGAR
ncbi:MAG: ABC transporter substrate-binding protein, partial [Burkholderiales bacterium]